METVHEHPQQFFPIADFLTKVEHDLSDERHDPEACVLEIEEGHVSNRVVYRLLRNDILILDQHVQYREAEHSAIAANPAGNFYLVKYVYKANLPIDCIFNGSEVAISEGFLSFCNNFGNHEMLHPPGFEGRYLQLLIERSFLEEYIGLENLRGSSLECILFDHSGEMLSLPVVPNTIRRKLGKITQLVQQPTDSPFDKLFILKAVADVLESFFTLFTDPYTTTQPPVENVAAYLARTLYKPFPGLMYLSHRFGASPSTLKRQFATKYGIPPHQYFRRLQMQEAARLLSETDTPVAEVGYRLGFDSPGNFTRAFKSAYRISPNGFRRDRI